MKRIISHRLSCFFSSRKPREWYCDVCGAYLRSIDGILEGDKVVTCSKCRARVCKYRCSSLTQREGWTCTSCLRPSESWFQGILSAIHPSKKGEPFWLMKDRVHWFSVHLSSLNSGNMDRGYINSSIGQGQKVVWFWCLYCWWKSRCNFFDLIPINDFLIHLIMKITGFLCFLFTGPLYIQFHQTMKTWTSVV